MKYGLALEGGGARGAYHIGAVKALIENGYEFDTIVGTSIGAINAAYLAQNDLDKAYDLWHTKSYGELFDIDNDKLTRALKIDIDLDIIKYLSQKLGQALKEKGIDTLKMRKMLEGTIDEERIRKSDIKFGLVTICLSDMKGQELYIDQIPEGKLIDYIMASSNLPVFKRSKIDDKKYMDGGTFDNCPVNMLEKGGCKEVFAIRTYKIMRIRGYRSIIKRNNVKIHMIEPVDRLCSILNFDTNNLNELLKLGYYDALKSIKRLDGYRYYIKHETEEYFYNRINNVELKEMEKILKLLNIKLITGTNIKSLFLKKALPILVSKTKLADSSTYKKCIYSLLEHVALKQNIERYNIYDFDELLKITLKDVEYKGSTKYDEAIYRLLKHI